MSSPTSHSATAVVVREVVPGDAAQLQANCFSQNTVEEVARQIDENLRGAGQGTRLHLVAEVDGIVAGSALLIRDPHPLHRHRAGLFGLVVSTAYQRRGIARRLVEALGTRAATLGIEILETSCRAGTAAEAVYARLGFTAFGRLPRGIREPWGSQRVYDQVYFYRPVADAGS